MRYNSVKDMMNYLGTPKATLWEKILWKLSDAKYWFYHRFHPSHRYNIIHTGLPPGYYDKDTLMEHAIARLLIDYFEREDRNHRWEDTDREDDYLELKQLYQFFRDHWEERNFGVTRDELTQKLVRVVELRGILWS